MIDISDLSYHIGLRPIFEDASCFVADGTKTGLVGLNGCGKTTLFRLILGQIYPDGGKITISSGTQISTVEQEIKDTNLTPLEYVLQADKRLKVLYDKLTTAKSGEEIAEIYDKLNNLGANSASARASAILGGLGFLDEELKKPLKELSGGWRVRASLAAALFAPSDILLLDEPTNHLDLETSIWLESFLEKTDKTLFLISHDRNLLNKICEKIILVDECKLKTYTGNYDTYERTRHNQTEQIIKDAKRYEETRKHLQSFVDRFRYKATKAKQAQSRLKMLERMGDAPKIPIEKSVRFSFPEPELLDAYLYTLEQVSCGYNDTPVLQNIDLTIGAEDKIALLGANGNGKSTLAKLLAGLLPTMSGKLTYARKIKVGYFAQHQTEVFDLDKTPYEVAKEKMPEAKEAEVYTHLACFGLQKNKADTKIGSLSGGEKSRLLLSIITIARPNILILDEPTNHLDITSRRALSDALNNYSGAVILVTHDFNLLEEVTDRLLLVANGTVQNYEGDLEDYKNFVLHGGGASAAQNKADIKKERRRTAAELRAQAAPIKKQIKEVEKKLDKLTTQKQNIEQRLTTQFNTDLSIELAFINKEIADLESKWLELTTELENLK